MLDCMLVRSFFSSFVILIVNMKVSNLISLFPVINNAVITSAFLFLFFFVFFISLTEEGKEAKLH